jgi:hypothetical protein
MYAFSQFLVLAVWDSATKMLQLLLSTLQINLHTGEEDVPPAFNVLTC